MAQDQSYFLKSRYVKELTPSDFESVVVSNLKDKRCAVVLFYADWCGHCKAVKDTWEDLGKVATFMEVYAFNCAKYTGHLSKIKEERSQLVKGYPTIIFYSEGEPKEQFMGERTREGLLKACMAQCK
jgi:thiol-disulfide isomerase/thioredoxin